MGYLEILSDGESYKTEKKTCKLFLLDHPFIKVWRPYKYGPTPVNLHSTNGGVVHILLNPCGTYYEANYIVYYNPFILYVVCAI